MIELERRAPAEPFAEVLMMRKTLSLLGVTSALVLVGCVTPTTALAPGAASVRIVRTATDVVSCKVVGNVAQPPYNVVDLRNLTIGLGGDTLFVTDGLSNGYVSAGIAYRCSK
jgi:hypothetical protein